MDQQSFKLALASAHHIQSFNFIGDSGLAKTLAYFTPMELNQADIPNDILSKLPSLPFRSFKISFSQLKINQPYRFNDPTALHQEIYPQ